MRLDHTKVLQVGVEILFEVGFQLDTVICSDIADLLPGFIYFELRIFLTLSSYQMVTKFLFLQKKQITPLLDCRKKRFQCTMPTPPIPNRLGNYLFYQFIIRLYKFSFNPFAL